jgi:hypothetical protein
MAAPSELLKYGRVVVGGGDLGLRRQSLDDLIADVREFRLESALAVLLRLNLSLTHQQSADQIDLLGLWLPDLAERILAAMRRLGATEVFHEAQVLNLIRLVILFAPADGRRHCDHPADLALLARIMLQLTSQITDPPESDRRARVFSTFTRMELFLHDEHLVPEATTRSYELFVLVPRLLKHRFVYDLPATFTKITGMSVEDYIGLGFALLTHYVALKPNMFGHGDIGIDKSRYLADAQAPAEVRERLWPLVSKPFEEYRQALQDEWNTTAGPGRLAAMRTFGQFPMIELPSGTVVAVSHRLLRDRITHGIYWILANGLSPGAERQAFTNFFGHVFEAYVTRCLTRAAGRGFTRTVEYEGSDKGKRPEGALITSRSIGFIEAKARRLWRSVRESGSEAELRAAVEVGLDEAADQLRSAIDAGRRGAIRNVTTNAETTYYPMIVTYEPLPFHLLAASVYEEIVYKGGRLKGDGIKPVTLLTLRDVEALEAIVWAGGAWPDLLTRKHTRRYEDYSFHNYLHETFKGALPRNEYLRFRWRRIGDMIGMRLFGQPLNEPRDRWRPRRRKRPR